MGFVINKREFVRALSRVQGLAGKKSVLLLLEKHATADALLATLKRRAGGTP